MTDATRPVLMLAATVAIAACGSEPAATAPTRVAPPPTAAAPPVEPAQPRAPEPVPGLFEPAPGRGPELHVAIEGFCRLDLAVVGADVFAFDRVGNIVRLGVDGPVRVPAPPGAAKNRRGEVQPRFEGLHGRGRDALYASFVTARGSGLADGLMRLDGARWTTLPEFGRGETIRSLVPWTDERMLVHVLADRGESLRDELRVVGKRGGAPNIAALDPGCAEPSFSHPTVDRLGNLAIPWWCGLDPRVAIWPVGASTAVSHRIAMDPAPGPFAVAPDQRGAFYVAFRHLVVARADPAGVQVLELPGGGESIQHFDVDPEGRPWVAYNEVVHRQSADGWAHETVPGSGFLEQLVGVAQGAAWVRRGGSTYRHGLQLGDDEQIYARDTEGRWRSVERAHAVFKPDERLHVDLLHADGAGGLFMTAHGESRLARPDGDALPYTAIVTTTPVRETLRCADERGEPIAW